MKKVFIDFEFNTTKEAKVNLVCCVLKIDNEKPERYWLYNSDCSKFKNRILELRSDSIFISFAVTAEARSFIALNINPIKCKWIDLYLEYRMLLNSNHNLEYGQQLIRGKVISTIPKPNKWELVEEDESKIQYSKPEYSLTAACYKLLGEKIDGEYKQKMRDIIISNSKEEIDKFKGEILDYCEDDIKYLPKLLTGILEKYVELLTKEQILTLSSEMLLRGEYAARTALMESIGYPVDINAINNFMNNVPTILKDIQEDINSQFELKPFKWNKARGQYSEDQILLRSWVEEYCTREKITNWLMTEKGKHSLKLEAWEKFFPFKHGFPRNKFPAQVIRWKRFRQSLNGFLPTKDKDKRITSYIGKDNYCRPYMGIYGSQTARSQPKATTFIPLKSAWMRSMILAPKGYAICGLDYKSQEFLLAALVSEDEVMYNSYCSGDVYLDFAKLSGLVPKEGTKAEYKRERNLCKAAILGIGYGMQAKSLALKLSMDSGQTVTESEAQVFIDNYNKSFYSYFAWKKETLINYKAFKHLKLPCGWYMWGDNKNERSYLNFAIQGIASSIMRKAVALAQDSGLTVIYTLHDAIYIQFRSDDLSPVDKLRKCMIDAFTFYFKGKSKRWAESIGLDGSMWSIDYPEETTEVMSPDKFKIKRQRIYVDDRGELEFKFFQKYLTGQLQP